MLLNPPPKGMGYPRAEENPCPRETPTAPACPSPAAHRSGSASGRPTHIPWSASLSGRGRRSPGRRTQPGAQLTDGTGPRVPAEEREEGIGYHGIMCGALCACTCILHHGIHQHVCLFACRATRFCVGPSLNAPNHPYPYTNLNPAPPTSPLQDFLVKKLHFSTFGADMPFASHA